MILQCRRPPGGAWMWARHQRSQHNGGCPCINIKCHFTYSSQDISTDMTQGPWGDSVLPHQWPEAASSIQPSQKASGNSVQLTACGPILFSTASRDEDKTKLTRRDISPGQTQVSERWCLVSFETFLCVLPGIHLPVPKVSHRSRVTSASPIGLSWIPWGISNGSSSGNWILPGQKNHSLGFTNCKVFTDYNRSLDN